MIFFFRKALKFLFKNSIYKSGTTATILSGNLQGYKYVISENSGWAPIYGGWEPEAQRVYCRLVRRGQVVYDLGANTGIHAALFSKLVGTEGQVYAFEPLNENFIELESLKSLNSIDNLFIIDSALGKSNGSMNLKIGKHNKQGSLVGIGCEIGDEAEVQIRTLDSLIQDGLPSPDFLKVDIEGAEGDALEGFSNSISDNFPTFSIDLHTPGQDVQVGVFLSDHGYNLYRVISPMAKQLINQKKLLAQIPRQRVGWPDLQGTWGTIVAVHPSRTDELQAVNSML